MHRLVRAGVQALAAAIEPYEASAATERATAAAAAAAGGRSEAGSRRSTRDVALAGVAQLLQRRLSARSTASSDGGGGGCGSGGSSGLVTPAGGRGAPGSGGRLLELSQLAQSRPASASASASARRSSAGSRRSTRGAPPPTAVPGAGPPSFAGAMLACLEAGGRLPENKRGAWAAHRCVAEFGISEDGKAAAEAVAALKQQVGTRPRARRRRAGRAAASSRTSTGRTRVRKQPAHPHPPSLPSTPATQVNRGDFGAVASARPAAVLLLLDGWFSGFDVGRAGAAWAGRRQGWPAQAVRNAGQQLAHPPSN
jgi:hypothetical protein